MSLFLNQANALRGKLRQEWLQLVLLGIVILITISAPLPPQGQLALGSDNDPSRIENFWQPEQNGQDSFRWTNGYGIIWLREYANVQTLAIALRLRGPEQAASAPVPLTIRTDERPIARTPLAPGWRVYHLLLKPNGTTWRTPDIDLVSPIMRPGPGDTRRLGIVVSTVGITPLEGLLALPLALRACTLVTLVVLLRALFQLFWPRSYALWISIVPGLLVALLWRLAPTLIEPHLPPFWQPALFASSLAIVLVYATQARQATQQQERADRLAYLLFLLPLALLVLITLICSLQWRMFQDSPLLMYIAFLVDQYGALPYRDIFDQNMPGALGFYVLVGRVFGYGDLGFRLADLLVLALLSLCTWVWGRRIHPRYAAAIAIIFALMYLSYGQSSSMQRDYVLLLPIAAALALAVSKVGYWWQVCLIGVLFGLAATIKPQAAIGLPAVLIFVLAERKALGNISPRPTPHTVLTIALAGLGFALPILGCLLYLVSSGTLDAFLDMVSNYLPLFAQLDGNHRTIAAADHGRYLFEGYLGLGGHYAWLGIGLFGAVVALRWSELEQPQRRQVGLMLALTFCYSLYPLAQGRFWFYHWLPFLYSLALLAGLCVLPQPKQSYWLARAIPMVLLILVIIWRAAPANELSYQVSGHPLLPIKNGRVDQIAVFLKAHLKPGETVQPLDWTGGALHGMLFAEARVATPFIYDFQFYHHISQPYIQLLRQRFMQQLRTASPRFIIDMGESNTLISGADTSTAFPELTLMLQQDYRIAQDGDGYLIYEHK